MLDSRRCLFGLGAPQEQLEGKSSSCSPCTCEHAAMVYVSVCVWCGAVGVGAEFSTLVPSQFWREFHRGGDKPADALVAS